MIDVTKYCYKQLIQVALIYMLLNACALTQHQQNSLVLGPCLTRPKLNNDQGLQWDLLMRADEIIQQLPRVNHDHCASQQRSLQMAWYWLEGRKYTHMHQHPDFHLQGCSPMFSLEQLGFTYLHHALRHGAKRPQIVVRTLGEQHLQDERTIEQAIHHVIRKCSAYPLLDQMVWWQGLFQVGGDGVWRMLWLVAPLVDGVLAADMNNDHLCLHELSWRDVLHASRASLMVGKPYAGLFVLGSD